MSAFASAQNLGGAVVHISGDDTALKAKIAEVERERQALIAKPWSVTLSLNTSALQNLQQQINTATAKATVFLPVAFDPRQASAALVNLTRQLQMQANAVPVILPVQWGNPGPAPAPGSGGGGGGGGGRGGSGFPRGFGRLLGAMAAFRAIEGGIESISKAPEYQEAVRKQSPHVTADELILGSGENEHGGVPTNTNRFGFGSSTAVSNFEYGALSRLPLVGPIIKQIAGAMTAGPLADAQKLSEKSDKMEVQANQIKEVTTGIARNEDSAAMVGASPEKKFAIQSAQKRDALEEELGKMSSIEQQKLGPAAHAALEKLLTAQFGEIQKDINDIVIGYQVRYQTSSLERGSAQAMAKGTGGEEIQFQNQQAESRIKLLESQRKELEKETDPTRKDQLQAAQGNELAAFDEKAGNDKVERQRHINEAIASEVAKGHEAVLQADRKGYAARQEAFETAADKLIAAARTKSAEEQAATSYALAQERGATWKTAVMDSAKSVANSQMEATSATMQAGGMGFEASLASYAQKEKQEIDDMDMSKPGAEEAKAARLAALATTVRARQEKHNSDIAQQRGDLAGETSEATLRGQGMDALASTDAQIRQIKDAVATSDPTLFEQNKKLAAAKLETLRKQISGEIPSATYMGHGTQGYISGRMETPREAEERRRELADVKKAQDENAKAKPSDLMADAAKSLAELVAWLTRIAPGLVMDGSN